MNDCTAPTTAASVANYLLALGAKEALPISQMKLQKLLFYSHAWHLALKDRPLFDEDFQAWAWGPVVPDVYRETRQYGRGPVTGRVSQLEMVGDAPGLNKWRYVAPEQINDEQARILVDAVWQTHKAYTAIQLSNSTHASGEPWTIVKEQTGDLSSKPIIPNDLIASVFKAKMMKNAARNTAA